MVQLGVASGVGTATVVLLSIKEPVRIFAVSLTLKLGTPHMDWT